MDRRNEVKLLKIRIGIKLLEYKLYVIILNKK